MANEFMHYCQATQVILSVQTDQQGFKQLNL